MSEYFLGECVFIVVFAVFIDAQSLTLSDEGSLLSERNLACFHFRKKKGNLVKRTDGPIH